MDIDRGSWRRLRALGAMSAAVFVLACLPVRADEKAADASAEKAPRKVTTVEGITEYQLDNGLRVLLFPDPSKNTVTVNVTYLVGSRHEGRGEAGMAHLLEHMVFKGTPTYENIWGALEDHGARFNGTTWVDRTNYFETLPATDKNLEFALHMEADRMVNSTIAAEELAKEMTVVRNEFEMGENDPQGVLSERMMSAAYLWHNYGKSTIGNRSDIERVPVENLRKFYKKYYQPDNAMLVVAGKFDPDKTLALVQKHFGAIPRPERTLDTTYTEEPTQDGPRHVQLERVGDVSAAGLIYHIPAATHADYPAVQILEEVLTSQPAGRLYKALVETGLAASVRGSAYPWAEPGVMEIMAEVRLDQDAAGVLEKMKEIVEGVATADITEEEVERVKTRFLKDIKLAMTDSGRIGVTLSEAFATGDWRMFFLHRDRVKEVTVEEVRRVAGTYLLPSNRTSGLFVPTKTPMRATIPETPAASDLVANYTGSETIAEGEEFVATPESIEERTKRVELQPGFKLAMLSKKTRGNAVRASLRFHFGTEGDLRGNTTALNLIPPMLMRGTTKRDFQQLRDEIDRLQSRINVFGGLGSVQAGIETDRENIVAAIELLGEILRQPAFAPEQFETQMKETLAQMEQGLSDPRSLGFTAIRRGIQPWPEDDIRYVPTVAENIERHKAVSLGDLKELHSRFYGASNVDVAVVGDFDEDAVADALKKAFGDWKSPSKYTRIENKLAPYEASSETILTPDKQMAIVATAATMKIRDDDPAYPALDFAGYILGQSAKSRLLNRLRHQGGLSYGAGAQLQVDDEDEFGFLAGFAICAPANAVQAQEAMREEFVKWIADGVTDEELAEGKTSYVLKFNNSLANDQFVAGQLADGLKTGRTFAYHADLLAKIQSLSTADIKSTLSKHLGNAPFYEVKAGDLEAPPTDEATKEAETQ